MKSYLLIIVVCIFPALIVSEEVFAGREAGQVLAVRNKVYIDRNGSKSAAIEQMPLLLRDIVETDSKSRTKLFFIDDSILNIGELSRVAVEEYLYSPEKQRSKSIYRLMDGTLKVIVGRSDLEIHTPTAIAAARGTKFLVKVERTGAEVVTHLFVLEGNVMMSHINKSIKGISNVGKGQKSSANLDSAPTRPVRFNPETLKNINKATIAAGHMNKKRHTALPKLILRPQLRHRTMNIPKKLLIKQLASQIPLKLRHTPVDINVKFP